MSKKEKKSSKEKKSKTPKREKASKPKKEPKAKHEKEEEVEEETGVEEEKAEPLALTRLEEDEDTIKEESEERTPGVGSSKVEKVASEQDEKAPEVVGAGEEVEAAAIEEAVEKPEEEEEEGLEIVEEKFYDLNLRRIWNTPRGKRTPRAVRYVRDFVSRRMKSDEVSVSEETNHLLWARGISKPPRHLRLRVVKDKEDHVIIFPAESMSRQTPSRVPKPSPEGEEAMAQPGQSRPGAKAKEE